jgi:hypothetical protein
MSMDYPRKVLGMSNSDYHAMNDHLNRSFATAVEKGGGEVQQWLDEGNSLTTGSKSMTLGSRFDAIITGACEGKAFSDIVAIPPAPVLAINGARRGGKYDEWKAQAAARGLIDCNAEEAWQLERMYDHLMANDAARQLVEETTETQVSVFFELNGHRCRVRPDGVRALAARRPSACRARCGLARNRRAVEPAPHPAPARTAPHLPRFATRQAHRVAG